MEEQQNLPARTGYEPVVRWSRVEQNWGGFTGEKATAYGDPLDVMYCVFHSVGSGTAFEVHAEGADGAILSRDWARIESGAKVELPVKFTGEPKGTIVFTWHQPPDWDTVQRMTIQLRQPG